MELVNKLEVKLAELFKPLPPLSKEFKDLLVRIWPILALVFGVLQLLAAWGLVSLMRQLDRIVDLTNIYLPTASAYSGFDKFVISIGIAVLVVEALILLLAVQPLRQHALRGWKLLFIGALINVVYAVVSIFIDGRGIGSLFFSLLFAAIGFYLLFQVRDAYSVRVVKTTPAATKATK